MQTLVITRMPQTSLLGGEELHTLSVALFLRKEGWNIVFMTKCKVLKALTEKHGFKHIWLKDFPKSPTTKKSLIWFVLVYPFVLVLALFYIMYLKIRYKKFKLYMLNLGDKLTFGFWAKIFGISSVALEHATIGKWLSKNPLLGIYKWIVSGDRIKVVTVSNSMKTKLYPILKTHVDVIRNGVEIIEEIPDSKSDNSVLFVGRLEADKGFDIFCKIAKNNPSINFIAAGSGSLAHLAEDITNITCLGSVEHEELANLYKKARLFILPSTTHDPFGLVVCEALSYGCPVMTSSKTGVSEYLDSRFVCEIENFEMNFRDHYKKANSMRKKAYECSKEFDIQNMLNTYANFLNAL